MVVACCLMSLHLRALPAGFIAPCLPTSAPRPPSGNRWLHEIKHDGFRVIARKIGKRVKLYGRLGNDLTQRFPLIVGLSRGWGGCARGPALSTARPSPAAAKSISALPVDGPIPQLLRWAFGNHQTARTGLGPPARRRGRLLGTCSASAPRSGQSGRRIRISATSYRLGYTP
jgi:hypothetical protein